MIALLCLLYVLDLVFQYLVNRLTGKNVFQMTYFMLDGM